MKLDPRMRTANVRNAEPIQPTRQGLLDTAAIGTSPIPVVGDAMGLLADAHMYATDPASRTPVNYGLSAAGALLPWVPPAAATLGAMHVASKGRGAAPKGPGKRQRGIFGGENAKNAPLDDLARARKMKSEGAGRHEIWTKTGWFQGPDQKWRFEIDDSGAQYNAAAWGDDGFGNPVAPMDEAIQHEKLYENYPHLRDTIVEDAPRGLAGAYQLSEPGIPSRLALNTRMDLDEQLSAGLHEIQHAVQDQEGLLGGANPRQFMTSNPGRQFLSPYDAYRHAYGEVEARNVQGRQRMPESTRRAQAPWETVDVEPARIHTDYGGSHNIQASIDKPVGMLEDAHRVKRREVNVRPDQEMAEMADLDEVIDLTHDDLSGVRLTAYSYPGDKYLHAELEAPRHPGSRMEPTAPRGTGIGTAMYVRGLELAQQRGKGWTSDRAPGMLSPDAEAIYQRLMSAGVPFTHKQNRYKITPKKLKGVDFDKVEDALSGRARKKRGLLDQDG